uniref:Glutaredoxin and cysteine rich domain containing 2 n=1 Tax=Latimeria chalumnae TaxID=7897 RepID=H3AS55_LATCH
MEELQRKLSQRYEAKPRKVRFKISSAYSGRVLKQVYEDGQEMESPEEEYPYSFLPRNIESGEQMFGIGDSQDPRYYPSANLIAQKINVFRDGNKYGLAGAQSLFGSFSEADCKLQKCRLKEGEPSTILDFGKIIIYTSNLRIIRTPMDKKDLLRRFSHNREKTEEQPSLNIEGYANLQEMNKPFRKKNPHLVLVSHHMRFQEGESEHSCLQCKGSGCAPCSLCHGSKFSMLANRFKESFRALRCPACNENGLQPCKTCSQ